MRCGACESGMACIVEEEESRGAFTIALCTPAEVLDHFQNPRNAREARNARRGGGVAELLLVVTFFGSL